MARLLRAPSTADLLAREIRAAIASDEFKPGDALPQEALAARFGVSRSPFREALRLLEAQGVITYRPNRGAIVTQFASEELQEIIEICGVLEQALVSQAVARATLADIAEARMHLQRMSRETEHRDWLVSHFAFHVAINEIARRPKMLAIVNQYALPITHLGENAALLPQFRHDICKADRRLLDACEAKDPAAATAVVRDHYEPLARMLCEPVPPEAEA